MTSGVSIIKKADLKFSRWSGGSMTELFIYPPEASFEARDFLFSLVSATIDLEESVFSDLSGYTRLIMSLDNRLELRHDDDSQAVFLDKFEPHLFDGGSKTISHGRLRDFNFVLKTGLCQGDIQVISLTSGGAAHARKRTDLNVDVFEFAYAPYAPFVFSGPERLEVQAGDLLMLDQGCLRSGYCYVNDGSSVCDLIICLAVIKR